MRILEFYAAISTIMIWQCYFTKTDKEERKGAGKEGRKEGRDDEPGLAFILTPDSRLRAPRRSAIDSLLYLTTETLPFQKLPLVFCT